MKHLKWIKFHFVDYSDYKNFNDPIVKIIYSIVYILQKYLTWTGWRKSHFAFNKKKVPLSKNSSWVLKRFLASLFAYSFIVIHFIPLYPNFLTSLCYLIIIYFIWEIFIINIWFFFFYRRAQSIKSHLDTPENHVRLLVILFFQYVTIILCFAGLYYYFFSKLENCFVGVDVLPKKCTIYNV